MYLGKVRRDNSFGSWINGRRGVYSKMNMESGVLQVTKVRVIVVLTLSTKTLPLVDDIIHFQ